MLIKRIISFSKKMYYFTVTIKQKINSVQGLIIANTPKLKIPV